MSYRVSEVPPETDRSVVVIGINGVVVGLERSTGALRWTNQLDGGGTGEVFIAFRFGVLAVSAGGGGVYRLDYATGTTMWRAKTTTGGRATLLVEPDLIIVAKGGYIDAFSHDGAPLWAQELKGMGMGKVALALPGNLAQADAEGSG